MHRLECNAKPAVHRIVPSLPVPCSWVNEPTLLQSVAKTQKYVSKIYEKSHFEILTMPCPANRKRLI